MSYKTSMRFSTLIACCALLGVLTGCAAATNEQACATFESAFASGDLGGDDLEYRLMLIAAGVEESYEQAHGELADTIDSVSFILTAAISEVQKTAEVKRDSSLAKSLGTLGAYVQKQCTDEGFPFDF